MRMLSIICTSIIFANVATTHAEREKELFTQVYKEGTWQLLESKSGLGSALTYTTHIREELPLILKKLNIKTLLDVGCGDFNWMKEIDISFLDAYLGVDIVDELIAENKHLYEKDTIRFAVANVISDPLPKADAILCRSVVSLMFEKDTLAALANMQKSGATYLLLTTCPKISLNCDLPVLMRTTLWARPLNFERWPFAFPKPLMMISEKTEGVVSVEKCLGVWRMKDLPDLSAHLRAYYPPTSEQIPQV